MNSRLDPPSHAAQVSSRNPFASACSLKSITPHLRSMATLDEPTLTGATGSCRRWLDRLGSVDPGALHERAGQLLVALTPRAA
jgi:hypothetical protein